MRKASEEVLQSLAATIARAERAQLERAGLVGHGLASASAIVLPMLVMLMLSELSSTHTRARSRVDTPAHVDPGLELDQQVGDIVVGDVGGRARQREQQLLADRPDLPVARPHADDLEVAIARGRSVGHEQRKGLYHPGPDQHALDRAFGVALGRDEARVRIGGVGPQLDAADSLEQSGGLRR